MDLTSATIAAHAAIESTLENRLLDGSEGSSQVYLSGGGVSTSPLTSDFIYHSIFALFALSSVYAAFEWAPAQVSFISLQSSKYKRTAMLEKWNRGNRTNLLAYATLPRSAPSARSTFAQQICLQSLGEATPYFLGRSASRRRDKRCFSALHQEHHQFGSITRGPRLNSSQVCFQRASSGQRSHPRFHLSLDLRTLAPHLNTAAAEHVQPSRVSIRRPPDTRKQG